MTTRDSHGASSFLLKLPNEFRPNASGLDEERQVLPHECRGLIRGDQFRHSGQNLPTQE
jgi:hypothetical protein